MAMVSTTYFYGHNNELANKACNKAFENAKNDTTRYWFVVSNSPVWGYDIEFAGANFSDAQKITADIELTPGCGYGFIHIEIARLNWLLSYFMDIKKVAVDLTHGGEACDLYAEVFGEPLN